MNGYSSTSFKKDEAIYFATHNIKDGKFPVVMEIKFTEIWNYFRMNSPDYSAIPEEQEVLIQDGKALVLEDIKEEFLVSDT